MRGISGCFITITRKKERKRRREEKESLITLLTLLRKVERFFLSSEDEIEEFLVTLLILPRKKERGEDGDVFLQLPYSVLTLLGKKNKFIYHQKQRR